MVDIYGSHFEYAGVSSREYGLIIANAETKRNTNLSGSIKGVTVFNKATKSVSLVDNDYSGSPVSIDIEIVTDDAQPIGRSEMREIEKWLFNRANYRKLYLDEHDDIYGETYEIIDGEQKRLYLNCRFVNPSRLEYNNGVIGYKATMEADSGYWWQDSVTKIYAPSDNNVVSTTVNNLQYMMFDVNVDTDIDEYVYPSVSFTTANSVENVTIVNITDGNDSLEDVVVESMNTMATTSNSVTKQGMLNAIKMAILFFRNTIISDIPESTTVNINGVTNGILTNNGESYNPYEHFINRNFPRLLDGINTIFVIGNITTISFEYKNRRML